MKSKVLASFALLICVLLICLLPSVSWGQKQHSHPNSHVSRYARSYHKHSTTSSKHSAARSEGDVSLKGVPLFPDDKWASLETGAFQEKRAADEKHAQAMHVILIVGVLIGLIALYPAYFFIGRSLSDRNLRKAMEMMDNMEATARLDPSKVSSFDFVYYDKWRDKYTERAFVSEGAARKKEEEKRREQSAREDAVRARQLKVAQNIPAPPKAPPVSRHLSDQDIANIVSSNASIIASMPSDRQEKSLQDWHQSNISHYGPFLAKEILRKVQATLGRHR